MPPPVTVPGPGGLPGGGSAAVRLPLPAGRWELSLQYISSFDFDVSAQGRRWKMPAYLGRQGFELGRGPQPALQLEIILVLHAADAVGDHEAAEALRVGAYGNTPFPIPPLYLLQSALRPLS